MVFWGKIGIPEKKGEATPTLLASSGLVMKPFSESTRVYEYGGALVGFSRGSSLFGAPPY